MNGLHIFKARRRWYTWLTDVILIYIIFIIAPWPILEMYIGAASVQKHSDVIYLLALCPIIGFVTILFTTRRYSVMKECVKIHLVGCSFSVFIPEIENINRIHWLSTFFGFRVGFGGIGECSGIVFFPSLGMVTTFITNRKNLVLIEKQDGKKLLISPEHPDEFIKTVINLKEQFVPEDEWITKTLKEEFKK
jgi:hypothetical protein